MKAAKFALQDREYANIKSRLKAWPHIPEKPSMKDEMQLRK